MLKERLTARHFEGLGMAKALFGLAIAAGLTLCAIPAQARALNIVAIGASNTSGWGVGSQNAYPAQLQALLRKRGISANVTNAGILGDVTAGMLRRLDATVPNGTDIVILQPGGNDLRFFGSKQARAANVAAMAQRLRARHIRVIVYDPEIPKDFYQFDGIHFNAAAHAKIAATLAAQIAGLAKHPGTTATDASSSGPRPVTAAVSLSSSLDAACPWHTRP
jgi:acyl-CoA thioesterase-1